MRRLTARRGFGPRRVRRGCAGQHSKADCQQPSLKIIYLKGHALTRSAQQRRVLLEVFHQQHVAVVGTQVLPFLRVTETLSIRQHA